MPIKGLTDNGAAFPRIGELRKGGVKSDPKRPGPDLDYFRFTSSVPGVENRFGSIYGKEPQSVNVFLPYHTTEENFEAWKEAWVAGGLQHRCDGEFVAVMQQGGQYVKLPHGKMKCPGGCKQVGRLRIIIPELGRLAYVVALTTSIWDIAEIHANLMAYEALRGSLQGIPFVLSRVPRMISMPASDGKRVRREKWLWHMEADSQWVQAQLSVMQRQAMPSGGVALALNSGEIVNTDTGEIVEPPDDIEGEFVETQQPPAATEPEFTPANAATLKALHAAGNAFYGKAWDTKRHELVASVSGGRATSSKGLTDDEAQRLIKGINNKASQQQIKGEAHHPHEETTADLFGGSRFTGGNGAYQEG